MLLTDRQKFETTLAGRPLVIETGEYARQANGAVMVHYGDTVVLATATASKEASRMNFFPLTVHYVEKMYAVGKLPGGFIKREGRPSENATLTSRLIDRPLRPMFPENVRNEIQILSTVLSVNQDNSPEIAAMIGSSIALAISDIPFNGPIAGVNVGRVDGELVINPTVEQAEASDIELTVAGTKHAINMVESAAAEASEEDMLKALKFGHETIKELVEFQETIVEAVGKEKFELELAEIDTQIQEEVAQNFQEKLSQAIQTEEKLARGAAMEAVHEEALAYFEEKYHNSEEMETILSDVKSALNEMNEQEVRRLITQEDTRPDGRAPDEIRPLESRVCLLPRTHGSGLFTRGQTQTLTVATLGALSDYQVIDGLGTEESKHFIHHYNFPSFSVGETGRVMGPGRREIGHGALGERALEQVLPSHEEFPYVIRLVSEVLESNGSSSQASICSGTLALMDAGVPIKAPVAGIAMGLVMEGEDYTVLTDIQGLEDALGDMDFKVAGTAKGITALQMDIKISGITDDILEEALEQAKHARLHIIEDMTHVIAEPRKELSPYAPKIEMIQIDPDKIRVVIGRGGETINQLIDETGVQIDIEDDGRVSIVSSDQAMIDKARETIELLTHEVKESEEYEGTVKRVENFGAFVEILPGKEGLVHISEIEHFRIDKVEDILNVGDKVKVKVIEIDRMGRLNLSRKALIPR